MNINTTLVAMLLGAALATSSPAALAKPVDVVLQPLLQNGPQNGHQTGKFASEHGPTLPPIGYVNFCAENPKDCVSRANPFSPATVAMSPALLETLFRVNSSVNERIEPVSDETLYGTPERWTYPTASKGDCEDYVLTKKQQLASLGIPDRALRITVVLDERGEGHAVLTIPTSDGDYVLDNRRNDILRWNATNYTFLKRQSDQNPRQWVSLKANQPASSGTLSASRLH
jgi:predicted transglutaminase-like cysteine proteinase